MRVSLKDWEEWQGVVCRAQQQRPLGWMLYETEGNCVADPQPWASALPRTTTHSSVRYAECVCVCKIQFTADPCSSDSEFTGLIKNMSLKTRMELSTSEQPVFSPWNRSRQRRTLCPLAAADNVSRIIPHHLIHSFIGSFTGWSILEVLYTGWSFSEGRQFSVKAHWWLMPAWLIASIKL